MESPVSVSSVTADDITRSGVTNVGDIIGNLPNVASYRSNPTPNISIRGLGPASSQSPLFIVDGVPSSSTIDPSLIERIDVIKGPAAASLYGAQAANGVVYIRTRTSSLPTVPSDAIEVLDAAPQSALYGRSAAGAGVINMVTKSGSSIAVGNHGECGFNSGVPLPAELFSSQGEPTIGEYNVTEFFSEIDLPLISGRDGDTYLGLWGAYRPPGQPRDTETGASQGSNRFFPTPSSGTGTKPGSINSVFQEFRYRAALGASAMAPDLQLDLPTDYAVRAARGFQLGATYVQPYSLRSDVDLSGLNDVPGQTGWGNDFCTGSAVPLGGIGYVAAAVSPVKSVKDQWAFKRVGAASAATENAMPITVAIIDTGIDWDHLDMAPESIWRNEDEVPRNGKDDDNNGFVDDVMGWDFVAHSNSPWDYDGHGTFVAGIVAATHGNNTGIDGINPKAKIMALKALNGFGQGRGSSIAQAILYAADNGAKIINLSVNPRFPRIVQEAVDYAVAKGVLIIAAAGNTAANLDAIHPSGLRRVMTVAATDGNDKRAAFSNVGSNINVAAPGVDVVSLRARRTDFLFDSAETQYQPGDAFIGDDKRYYRATGTSFATAITSGVASLVWSQRPALSHTELQQVLEQSARDVETPGRDRATGYGIIDAKAALTTDPAFFVNASIPGVRRIDRDGLAMLQVIGTADADGFGSARLEIGSGEAPETWQPVGGELLQPVKLGELGKIPADRFAGEQTWTIRVVVTHQNGKQREGRFIVDLS